MIEKLRHAILIAVGLVACLTAIAQGNATKMISGVVVDKDNRPLAGVVVIGKDSPAGAVTDNKGKFSITVPESVGQLEFSMLGFLTQTVDIGSKTQVEIYLQEGDIKVDEVVVVGYGATRKGDLTGSVGTVRVDDLTKAPVASFADALAGRVAGVSVSSADGQPGAATNITIRGASSMTQNNSPLYVVDRVPMESFDPASISSEDIESISILKDASAIAIYGARAANGVVVVTTKKGAVGRPIVDLSVKAGFPRITKTIDMMGTYEYVKYLEELNPDRAARLYFNDGKTLEDYRNIPGINWQKEILNDSPVSEIYDLAVYGGNNETQYRVSGSYYNQDGVLENSGYSSFRGRAYLQQSIRKNLLLTLEISASSNKDYGQYVAGSGDGVALTNLMYRVWGYRPYSPNGNLEDEFVDEDFNNNDSFWVNPIISNRNEHRQMVRNDSRTTLSLQYKLTKDLTFLATGSSNSRKETGELFNNSKTQDGTDYNFRNTRGQWGRANSYSRRILTNENTLTYKKKINLHQIDAVAGLSFEKGKTQSFSFTAINVPNEELGMDGLGMGVPYQNAYSTGDYTMVSYYGRINYSYDKRYLVTFTMRADGSSKFAPGNRWGYFPSAAVAWNVAEEQFMKNIRQISSLKLRASYGIIGNNRIGNYDYLASMATGIDNYYSFGNQTPSVGVGLNKMTNPYLQWESTRQLDLGLELGLLGGRIRLEADYYNKRTHDLLLNSQIPSNTGYTYAMMNVGKTENQGLEISLETTNVRTSTFTWSSQFNISFNRNKVMQLNNSAPNRLDFPRIQNAYNNQAMWISAVGKPVGMFYGLVFDGVYQYGDFMDMTEDRWVLKSGIPDNGSSVSPGDIKYRDINGDGTINDYDKVVIGNPNPKHIGGFNNNFTYNSKKWGSLSLNVFLQWSYGNDVFNANRLLFEGNALGTTGLNQYASYKDRWTPGNPSNTLFKTNGSGPQGYISDRTLEDGSFLRLKTLELSYGLPQRLLRKANGAIRSVSFSVAVQNLFTITNYSGLDPEVSTMGSVLTPGFDFCAYPRARVVTFGCRIRF